MGPGVNQCSLDRAVWYFVDERLQTNRAAKLQHSREYVENNVQFRSKLLQQTTSDVDRCIEPNVSNACPQYLSSLLHTYTPTRQLRSASLNLLSLLRSKIALASRGFRHTGPSIWNYLPPHLRSIDTSTAFKSNLKTHLLCSASISGP